MRHQFATVHELARIEMLAGVPGETLGRLAERMTRRELGSGDVILEAEDDRGRFYVLLSGMLTSPELGILRPGDTFGGLTLFGQPVAAMMPSVVATCDQATFEEFVRPIIGSR